MTGKHRDAAAYGLGVLDDPAEFETHLRDCARCRSAVVEFRSLGAALTAADRLGYLPGGSGAGRGYPLPVAGASRRRKPGAARRGSAGLLLVVLGVAATAVGATRPSGGRERCASAASIVSPARVVAGSGGAVRDLPWSAGFQ